MNQQLLDYVIKHNDARFDKIDETLSSVSQSIEDLKDSRSQAKGSLITLNVILAIVLQAGIAFLIK